MKLVFGRALRAAFASTLIAAGCSDTHSDGPTGSSANPDRDNAVAGARTGAAGGGNNVGARGDKGTPPRCDGKTRLPLEDLDPASHVDYVVELVALGGSSPPREVGHYGAMCVTANPQCNVDVDAAKQPNNLTFSQSCGQIGSCRYYFVATDADQVKRYTNREELFAFLGGINTPQEAFLLVEYDGYDVRCAENTGGGYEIAASAVMGKDGFEVTAMKMLDDCPVQMAKVVLTVSRAGVVTEVSSEPLKTSGACIGRRPEGWLAQSSVMSNGTLADHFAIMASLEAASVTAFEVLAAELAHYGAPQELVERMHAAAREEIVHARETTAMARLYGAEPEPPQIEARPIRTLEDIALDNAVEGCVRETFGAAVGCYQADQARDGRIASLMQQLAADEIGHAALAFDLHVWLMPQLSLAARARVIAAHVAAIDDLSRELEVEPPRALRELAGMPGRVEATRLFDTLRRELWFAGEIFA